MSDKQDQLIKVEEDALAARSEKGEVAAFLAKTKIVRRAQEAEGLKPVSGWLIFALDATMSRQPTWDEACSLQGEMFGVAVRTWSACHSTGLFSRDIRMSGQPLDAICR